MPLLNASGNPVVTQPRMVQIDVPCEPVANPVGAINIVAALQALWQLFAAYQTGNPDQIIAAFQALIKALTGG